MKKLAFIYSMGLGMFIKPIIEALNGDYDIRDCPVDKQSTIDRAIGWADIIWFEFCNEVAMLGTQDIIEREKKVIIRLHSYEVFTDIPKRVNWNNIDNLIFVAPHIREIFMGEISKISFYTDCVIIPNGIDVEKIKFNPKKSGANIAMIANINYKKNIPMALQIISKLKKEFLNLRLHIAGKFQDKRYEIYLKHMIDEMKLNDSIIFDGKIDNISEWLQDKHFILSTSIHEGHPYNIMEGMAAGCKPVIHNYYGAAETWKKEYLFNTVNEAVEMFLGDSVPRSYYRGFIKDNYSFDEQIKKIREVLNEKL